MDRPVVLPANQPPDRFYRGGERIRAFRGRAADGDRVPEDWVGSSTTLFGEASLGLATLPDGRTVREAQADDPESWFGPAHVAARGSDPFVLVKLLDAGERLPVHLHPDDPFASLHLGSVHGKTEAWVILEGGQVGLGFRREVGADELATWVDTQDVDSLLGAMRTVDVGPGDGVLVPAGMPHAIGEGVFMVEVQQPTDFSILLEWEGFAIDGREAGHLGLGWTAALAAVDRGGYGADDVERLVVRQGTDGRVLPREADPFFRVLRHEPVPPVSLPAGFRVLVVTSGAAELRGARGKPIELRRGSTVMVPFAAGEMVLHGPATVLELAPPEVGGLDAPAEVS